jgi:hypothetical protein
MGDLTLAALTLAAPRGPPAARGEMGDLTLSTLRLAVLGRDPHAQRAAEPTIETTLQTSGFIVLFTEVVWNTVSEV